MSKLSVLDADPLFAHQYISCLVSSISDIEHQVLSIQKVLFLVFSSASKASDKQVLDAVQNMHSYSSNVFYELQKLKCRFSHLTSSHSG
ncbi:hypothetical protein [Xylella fastidiosa]|uniref:hypothetical protein n=1 Tax=Xylella fastidiosa TaxID=2371 RepID=UPI0002DFE1B7|nr:hypothetical protein [Xylella fastidiosa]